MIGNFSIDRTGVTIGWFAEFVAATGSVTKAGREGGGLVYAAGWEQKADWTLRTPHGRLAHDGELAECITFDELQAYCRWAGKRLPAKAE